MLCRKCEQKQATFFLSRDQSRTTAQVGFCDACADEVGIFSALQKVESLVNGYNILSPDSLPLCDPDMPVAFADECRACGMKLEDFERDFELGCDHCCHIFGSLLFNYVSLLTPGDAESRLKPLYPGAAPGAPKKQNECIHAFLKDEIKRAKCRVKSDGGKQPVAAPGTPAPAPGGAARFIKDPALNPDPLSPWLQTRIEIRRNAADFPFIDRMTGAHRRAVRHVAARALGAADENYRGVALSGLNPLAHIALGKHRFDRLPSRRSMLLFGDDPRRAILLNDQDHFHFSYCGPESDPARAAAAVLCDVRRLERAVRFAYSPRFGYLTTAPRNMGAAASVSVLVHLPFSLTQGHLQFYPSRADRAGVRFEPYCGHNIERHGFFRVAGMVPFNATEEQIVRRVLDFAAYLVKEENGLREGLGRDERARLGRAMDRVLEQGRRAWRLSYQDILRYATFLTIGAALDPESLRGFSLAAMLPSLSSPFIMYRDRGRMTVNECEKRRADLFANLIEEWTNPLLAHPRI